MPRSKRATMLDLPEEAVISHHSFVPEKRCDDHGVGHAFSAEDDFYECSCGKIDDTRWPCGRCGGPVYPKGSLHDMCDY